MGWLYGILIGSAAGFGLMTWRDYLRRMRALRAYLYIAKMWACEKRGQAFDKELANRIANSATADELQHERFRIIDMIDSYFKGSEEAMINYAWQNGFKAK